MSKAAYFRHSTTTSPRLHTNVRTTSENENYTVPESLCNTSRWGSFLYRIITKDETWLFHYGTKSKQDSYKENADRYIIKPKNSFLFDNIWYKNTYGKSV